MTRFKGKLLERVGTLAWMQLLVLVSGCGSSVNRETTVFDCTVLIDGKPAADVHVVMQPKSNADIETTLERKFEGVSDTMGIAGMRLVEGALPSEGTEVEFRVAVESLGDWQIIQPWSDPQKSPLTVVWDGQRPVEIEIPKRAIKPL